MLLQEAFSEGIVLAMQRHDVEDKPVSPDELAARFCASNRSANEFRDSGSVLRGARHMVRVPLGLIIYVDTSNESFPDTGYSCLGLFCLQLWNFIFVMGAILNVHYAD